MLVQTTDFFYPNIDDPYVQGRIACANVLSDLYAMGVDTCDSMLMLLGVCREMEKHERDARHKVGGTEMEKLILLKNRS